MAKSAERHGCAAARHQRRQRQGGVGERRARHGAAHGGWRARVAGPRGAGRRGARLP